MAKDSEAKGGKKGIVRRTVMEKKGIAMESQVNK